MADEPAPVVTTAEPVEITATRPTEVAQTTTGPTLVENEYAGFTDQDAIVAADRFFDAYNNFDEEAYLAATSEDYQFVDER